MRLSADFAGNDGLFFGVVEIDVYGSASNHRRFKHAAPL